MDAPVRSVSSGTNFTRTSDCRRMVGKARVAVAGARRVELGDCQLSVESAP